MTENQEAVKAEETVQEEKAVAATQEAAAETDEEIKPDAEKKEEAVNPNLRTLEVTIDGKEFQDGVTKELRRLSKKAKMPGFRPGHVPFAMVEAMYGQQASAEVINTLLEREANKAMRDGQYRVVAESPSRSLRPKAARTFVSK
mgnify:CR=1 FL=1